MKRVLIVAADGLTKSGVPNVFINIIRNVSKFGYTFDVLYFDEKDSFYKEEIERHGGRAIYSPIDTKKTSKIKKLFVKLKYTRLFKKIFEKYGPYDCVHSFNGFESGYVLKAAKKMGVVRRISHMTFFYQEPKNILVRIIERNERHLVEKYSSCIVSDSIRTSNNNMPKSNKRIVIRNFVDDSAFKYSVLKRINNGINFVQIGSYCSNKNQLFSLELFEKIIARYPESTMSYVGFRNPDEVEYFDKLKNEVIIRGLSKSVFFYEHNFDTNELFARCNYLLFPSLIESFGIVVVEAQLSGLSCFCSDSISAEGNCGGCVYLPLNNVDAWVDTISAMFNKNGGEHKRYDCSAFMKDTITEQYLVIYRGEFNSQKYEQN